MKILLSAYLTKLEEEAALKLEQELEAVAVSGEVDQRSSDQQLRSFKKHQTEKLVCESPADAAKVRSSSRCL